MIDQRPDDGRIFLKSGAIAHFDVTADAAAGHLHCMKSPLLIAALSLCLTAPLWAQSDSSSDSTPAHCGKHHWHHGGTPLTKDERAELKSAHEAAIQANPDLVTQGKQLHEQMRDYMKKMHDAMVKADPKVEPIFAKMKAGHHHHGPPPDDAGGQ